MSAQPPETPETPQQAASEEAAQEAERAPRASVSRSRTPRAPTARAKGGTRAAAARSRPGTRSSAQEASATKKDDGMSELGARVVDEVAKLVREELTAARREARGQMMEAARAGAVLGASATAASLSVLFVSFGVARGLSAVMPRGLAYLLVAFGYGAASLRLLEEGKRRLDGLNVVAASVERQ